MSHQNTAKNGRFDLNQKGGRKWKKPQPGGVRAFSDMRHAEPVARINRRRAALPKRKGTPDPISERLPHY